MMGKHVSLRAIAVLVVALAFTSYVGHRWRLSPQRRANEAVLAAYAGSLRPGASRKQVEDFLRRESTFFVHSSPGRQGALSTLVRVQDEDAWLWSKARVAVAFDFSGTTGASDNDILTGVTLTRAADGPQLGR
jgi:hypothetical protein